MDRNETADDIVAEIRGSAERARECEDFVLAHDLDNIADRIEAAVKRERDQFRDVTKLVGDVSKMREALEKAKKAICHHAKYVCDSLSWENSNTQSNCADILCAHRDLCEAKTAINAAIAAPPRNCDRPECSTPKGAAQEWAKHCSAFADKDEECAGCLHQHQEHEAPCVVEWLLSPAAQEGGRP